MPVIKVFDFANAVKDYIRDALKYTRWNVQTILVFYSTRVKTTKFGYKVVPLEVGVIAYDTETRSAKNCRIKFAELCEIFCNDHYSVPYISVSDNNKHTREIFDEGTTYLSINCRNVETYNGTNYYPHNTVQVKAFRFERLKESVSAAIQERASLYHNITKKQYKDALDDLLNDNDEMQPEDYDYSDNISVSCTVGGFKDWNDSFKINCVIFFL